jgi:hypothetical protein
MPGVPLYSEADRDSDSDSDSDGGVQVDSESKLSRSPIEVDSDSDGGVLGNPSRRTRRLSRCLAVSDGREFTESSLATDSGSTRTRPDAQADS